ncbi:MAG: PadR family transcriptional regulator [Clostridia bacterium]|nr:PadR family transcriptional regulator [Clostridia bacterium]
MNIQFKKGILELCVLSILSRKNCYGYELVNEILEFMEISEGTIYPLLRRLKMDNLVTTYLQESNEGPPRKYYQLTELGKETHSELILEWKLFQASINKICLPEESK